METGSKAVVLLSGGLDSSTVAAIAQDQGFDVCALTFCYGQRNSVEIEAARKIAHRRGITRHVVVDIGLDAIGGSALTDDIAVPKGRNDAEIGHGVPATYVPARNTAFLSIALGWAEVLGAFDIFIGVNALDYSGYPDCRPEFIAAFERLANLATRAGVDGTGKFTIHAPLIHMSKADIIQAGTKFGVNYELTVSCYSPASGGQACGECDACLLRLKGFQEADLEDPIRYAKKHTFDSPSDVFAA